MSTSDAEHRLAQLVSGYAAYRQDKIRQHEWRRQAVLRYILIAAGAVGLLTKIGSLVEDK